MLHFTVESAKYYPDIFALSLMISIIASGAAIYIMRFVLSATKYKERLQFLAALVMGIAVCSTHYSGMAATVIIPYANCRFAPNQIHLGWAVIILFINVIIISATFFLITNKASKRRSFIDSFNNTITLYISGLLKQTAKSQL